MELNTANIRIVEARCSRVKLPMLTAILIACLLSSHPAQTRAQVSSEADNITFGIVPQKSTLKLVSAWVPLLKYLSKETGLTFQFKTAPSITEFERRVSNGEYDIAYMNPYHYIEFNKQPGYIAFSKEKNKDIRGIVVVSKDSSATELSDLHGKQMAFPAPAAFAASILPMSHMNEASIEFQPNYVSSHESVYLAVASGLYPAGGGVQKTLANTSKDVRDKLKILWTSKAYTSHALAAHPELDPKIVKTVTNLLVELDQTAEGKDLLDKLSWKGFEAAQGSQWDDVRSLNINVLQNKVVESAIE